MVIEIDVVLLVKLQVMQVFFIEYCGVVVGQICVFGQNDWMVLLVFGFSVFNVMVICLCFIGILLVVVMGVCNNFIECVVDVVLKECWLLVLVLCEVLFFSIYLENMFKLFNFGVVILLVVLGFYYQL